MFIFILSEYAGMSPDCISGIVSFAFLHFKELHQFFFPLRFFHLLQNILGERIPFFSMPFSLSGVPKHKHY